MTTHFQIARDGRQKEALVCDSAYLRWAASKFVYLLPPNSAMVQVTWGRLLAKSAV